MKYSEETALKIQKNYGVSDATLRTWKHRHSIPDQYADKLVPIKYMLKNLDTAWYSDFLKSLSDNQRKEFQRYSQDNSISSKATEKQIRQRIRDFRRWAKKII